MADAGDLQDPQKRLVKLSQTACRRFKEALFSKSIPMGTILTQAELVTLLDVPIGPLREALQVLESEGLAEMLPRSGIRIVKPDFPLIKDIFQLRRILECEAVRKFAERASAEELALWTARHHEVLSEAERGGLESELIQNAIALDRSFHATLIANLRNPTIEELYGKTTERIRLVRLDTAYMRSAITVSHAMQEHMLVLDALRTRDVAAAIGFMEDHLAASLHRAIGF
jgi:DNA-binding GntR family transcriptional regulator